MFKLTLSILAAITIVASANAVSKQSNESVNSDAYSGIAINLYELCTDEGKHYQLGSRVTIQYRLQECKNSRIDSVGDAKTVKAYWTDL